MTSHVAGLYHTDGNYSRRIYLTANAGNDLSILRGSCEYIKSRVVQQETLEPSKVLTALFPRKTVTFSVLCNAEFEMNFRIVICQVMTSYSLVGGSHILGRTL